MEKWFVVITSPLAPFQMDGITENGDYVYIRDRHGRCVVKKNRVPTYLLDRSSIVLILEDTEELGYNELIEEIEKALNVRIIVVHDPYGLVGDAE